MSVCLLSARIFATIIVAVGALSGVCFAEEAANSVTEQFMKNPDLPVIVRGDYFKAIEVAHRDFSKVLARRAKESKSLAGSLSELELRLSKIENYDIHVEQTPSSYTVWFRPTMRDTNSIVMGGGATYTVDRSAFSIIKVVFSK